MDVRYRDRRSAGRQLARQLEGHGIGASALILALPRGGVSVAYEIAARFHAELDVFVVRKLALPQAPELALGAIAAGGGLHFNHDLLHELGVDPDELAPVIAREQREIERRAASYRGDRPAPVLQGRTVVVVDDGLATGATMRASVSAIRQLDSSRIIVAVPVGSVEACALLGKEADAVVCPLVPEPFLSVGTWYEDFAQTSDDEVRDLLRRAARHGVAGGLAPDDGRP